MGLATPRREWKKLTSEKKIRKNLCFFFFLTFSDIVLFRCRFFRIVALFFRFPTVYNIQASQCSAQSDWSIFGAWFFNFFFDGTRFLDTNDFQWRGRAGGKSSILMKITTLVKKGWGIWWLASFFYMVFVGVFFLNVFTLNVRNFFTESCFWKWIAEMKISAFFLSRKHNLKVFFNLPPPRLFVWKSWGQFDFANLCFHFFYSDWRQKKNLISIWSFLFFFFFYCWILFFFSFSSYK